MTIIENLGEEIKSPNNENLWVKQNQKSAGHISARYIILIFYKILYLFFTSPRHIGNNPLTALAFNASLGQFCKIC